MNKRYALGLLLCLLLLAALPTPAAQQAESPTQRAKRILRSFDDLWRGDSSYGVFVMRVKTAHYTRTMRMETWSKGKEKTLVRIMSPVKEKGTATLKSGTTIYSYLPKTDRTIRLTSGMMMGSWMGSHFTNDDLVKESRMEEDYDPTISFEGERNGNKIIEFTLIPRPDAPVVWGKVILTVLAETYIPLAEVYYDEDMAVARTLTFSDVKPLGGQPRPAVMRVRPADKPKEYTELIYEKLEFDITISNAFFSLSRLKRK